jgi:hypothetical protein
LSKLNNGAISQSAAAESLGEAPSTWNTAIKGLDKWLTDQANKSADDGSPLKTVEVFGPDADGTRGGSLTQDGWELAAIGILLRWVFAMKDSGLSPKSREWLLSRMLYRFEQDWREEERQRVIDEHIARKKSADAPIIPPSTRELISTPTFDWLNAWVRPDIEEMTHEQEDAAWEAEMERHTRESFEDHFLPPVRTRI